MPSFASVPWLALVAGLVAVAGVGAAHSFDRKADAMTIEDLTHDVATAFNERYGDLYYRNPIDGKYLPIPPLSAGEFRLVEETDAIVRLIREPLVGMTVRAEFTKADGAIVFHKLEFAFE